MVVERGEHRVLVNLSDQVAEIPFSGITRPELLLAWDRDTAIRGDRTVRLPARAAGIVGPSSRHCPPAQPPLP